MLARDPASVCRLFLLNGSATPATYSLSLHDALPIWHSMAGTVIGRAGSVALALALSAFLIVNLRDRKSTRLNSSHSQSSYAVFRLKKKSAASAGYCLPELLRERPSQAAITRRQARNQ